MNNPAHELHVLKTKVAICPNRELALSVIVPRLLGAIKERPSATSRPEGLHAIGGNYRVQLFPEHHEVHLRLVNRNRFHVYFWARLFSGGYGQQMGGRATVVRWQRGQCGGWQEEIFNVFATDSTALLEIPITNEDSAVMRAVRADLAAASGS
jgi:hypothetical protein